MEADQSSLQIIWVKRVKGVNRRGHKFGAKHGVFGILVGRRTGLQCVELDVLPENTS